MEQALVRFGRFVNDMEGGGRGDNYIKLAQVPARFRAQGGCGIRPEPSAACISNMRRSATPCAPSYIYSGMADVAAETHDMDYQSAVMSLWDNIVNKKYYITGGIGSGETSEGFGPDYSLRNNAYCEACSSCGLIFFQYKMNLAYHDAKYADLYEETMYNALLGSTDLDGKNFYYDNPLDRRPAALSVARLPVLRRQHSAHAADDSDVDLREGRRRHLREPVHRQHHQRGKGRRHGRADGAEDGLSVERQGLHHGESEGVEEIHRLSCACRIARPANFTRRRRKVSGLQIARGERQDHCTPKIEKGYAVITRDWKAGDKIELELPMEVQRIKADENIAADRGLVALRYGPLIYNVERADQPDINQAIGSEPLTTEWRGDLLDGVMAIKGKWADGSPLLAIPNYARNNRNSEGVGSMVWIRTSLRPKWQMPGRQPRRVSEIPRPGLPVCLSKLTPWLLNFWKTRLIKRGVKNLFWFFVNNHPLTPQSFVCYKLQPQLAVVLCVAPSAVVRMIRSLIRAPRAKVRPSAAAANVPNAASLHHLRRT